MAEAGTGYFSDAEYDSLSNRDFRPVDARLLSPLCRAKQTESTVPNDILVINVVDDAVA